jgi:hypothetical protein
VNYCSKEETRTGSIYANIDYAKYKKGKKRVKLVDPLDGKELFSWQNDVINLIDTAPDDRTVYWFWDGAGCTGKTALAKHICIMHSDAIYISGSAKDMEYGIAQYMEKNGFGPRVCILNIPRSKENFVSWAGIEEIKDGILFSKKYESRMLMFNSPHVIVFANTPPDESRLSRDRWRIREIQRP